MTAVEPPGPGPELTTEEKAAVRGYLQRSEVRLSTMHRVASALLSGAGLMVLLPAVERDSVVSVLRALLSGETSGVAALLVAAIGTSLILPFTVLWFLLRDLTQFYFHANHLSHERGETFAPRFTLTGLRMPGGELGERAARALDAERARPDVVGLLVPSNDEARARIDRRLGAYGLGSDEPSDDGRAAGLFALAASQPRDLLNEVAKVEHGMARHVLRTQTIVLRYMKALLALLSTALAEFAAAAVVGSKPQLSVGDEAWLAAIFVLWAPVVVLAVTSPVRWLERQLRNEGATHSAVSDDPELTQVEVVTIRLAIAGFVAAALALGWCMAKADLTGTGRGLGALVLMAGAAALGLAIVRWDGKRALRRIVGARS